MREGIEDPSPAGRTIIDRIGISWRSAFRDVFLIVTSILIAFSLEAWWAGQETIAEERAALAAVRDDLRAARLELDSVLVRNDRVVKAISDVLAMTSAEIESLATDSALSLVISAYGGGLTFDPSTGALQGLLSAGTLSDIRNHRLAAELSSWPGLLDEIEEDQSFIIDSFNRLQAVRVETGTLESSMVHYGLLEGPPGMTVNRVLATLLTGERNRGELVRHLQSVWGLQRELAEVDTRLDALLSSLDAELGE
jgi:hypothetical protein